MTEKAETFLVSRSKRFCEVLSGVLGGSRFEIVGVAASISQTETKIREKRTPQIMLIDFSSDSEHGSVDLKRLRSVAPDAQIVVLAETLDPGTLADCLAAGAHGYLIQDISADALLQSLRLVMSGEKVFPTQLATRLVEGTASIDPTPPGAANSYGLSERDVEILRCLVQGASNKMIANRLDSTEATIKVHMKSLVRKINVRNRTQAAVWAHDNLNMLS